MTDNPSKYKNVWADRQMVSLNKYVSGGLDAERNKSILSLYLPHITSDHESNNFNVLSKNWDKIDTRVNNLALG